MGLLYTHCRPCYPPGMDQLGTGLLRSRFILASGSRMSMLHMYLGMHHTFRPYRPSCIVDPATLRIRLTWPCKAGETSHKHMLCFPVHASTYLLYNLAVPGLAP